MFEQMVFENPHGDYTHMIVLKVDDYLVFYSGQVQTDEDGEVWIAWDPHTREVRDLSTPFCVDELIVSWPQPASVSGN